jgi:hypothetical protein
MGLATTQRSLTLLNVLDKEKYAASTDLTGNIGLGGI